ncbi:GNAT family N-acetyltransferase [Sulfobacillus thermosulfidooxidans]|nr:GNAT family N-acetyltransferase [Sulfobacillus thermosulfidooxidans]OLZ16096.1 GNAT family N-acetyltransferase [Sulfobacillus thermosulfidooxidans]OLZ18056.1 GNAT family N-acetyltransferase [Sulfobacillus thermosulfidooxidans]
MLDKSLPYYNVIMKRPASLPMPTGDLPEGWRLCSYESGNDQQWAEIERSVGEFDNIATARSYFHDHYLVFPNEVRKRVLFVQSPKGAFAGTVTAWWNDTGNRRDASLHWLAVRPAYQRMGLGRALVAHCLSLIKQLEGHCEVWLHTQTWSHRAIRLYLSAGFRIVASGSFGGYANDFDMAFPILKTMIPWDEDWIMY